jgi:RNA polymerase sigma factor (sigma-70 family)
LKTSQLMRLSRLSFRPSACMSESPDFLEILQRIRAGDEEAARELVRRYGPLVRREVRMRMHDRKLNRVFDSLDVAQSVFARFFSQVAEDLELDGPEQLTRLLLAMARNRTISRVRSEHRMVRDLRRLNVEPGVLEKVPAIQPSPSECVLRSEELELLHNSLTEEERQIVELRNHGFGWEEIASRLGGTGQARRMQLSRVVDRLKERLGLDN